MTAFVTALAAIAAAQQPVPSINYSLPGQTTPAPLTVPATEVLPFLPANIVNRPSAAARHFLLASAPRIPATGLAFTIRCLLDRSNGRVVFCNAPVVPEGYRAAAAGLASLYQFRLTPAQMTTPGPLAVTIQDRIAPADVRPAARLFTFTTRPAAALTFAQSLTGELSQAYYPRDAMAANVETRIRLDCQVQPDLSLFCLNPSGDPGPYLAAFQVTALQLSGALRSAPTLANGAPAAGTIFRTSIIFRLPTERARAGPPDKRFDSYGLTRGGAVWNFGRCGGGWLWRLWSRLAAAFRMPSMGASRRTRRRAPSPTGAAPIRCNAISTLPASISCSAACPTSVSPAAARRSARSSWSIWGRPPRASGR